MANTYQLISSSIVGSGGVSSILFTGITQTYTDLYLVYSLRDTSTVALNDGILTINGVNTNTSRSYMFKYQGGFFTDTQANNNWIYANTSLSTASTFSNGSVYIPNYTSTLVKTMVNDVVIETNGTADYWGLYAGSSFWSGGAAITSLELIPSGSGIKYVEYSTAYLYGIKNS